MGRAVPIVVYCPGCGHRFEQDGPETDAPRWARLFMCEDMEFKGVFQSDNGVIVSVEATNSELVQARRVQRAIRSAFEGD